MQNLYQKSSKGSGEFWQPVVAAWATAVAKGLEALCGAAVMVAETSVTATAPDADGHWVEAKGLAKPVLLAMADDDARRLVGLLAADSGPGAGEPLEPSHLTILSEALQQFVPLLDQAIGSGSRPPMTCGALQDGVLPAVGDDPSLCCIELETADGQRLALSLVVPHDVTAALLSSSASAVPFPQLKPRPARSGGQNLSALLDVQLKFMAILGQTRVPLRDLLAAGPGSLMELDRKAGEPVELLVNGKLFGHGEVVVVDERLAIRILDVIEGAADADRAG